VAPVTLNRRFRLLAYRIDVPSNTTKSSGAAVELEIYNDAVFDVNSIMHQLYIPGSAGTALGGWTTGWVEINGGWALPWNANLMFRCVPALTAGQINLSVRYLEEMPEVLPAPSIRTVVPSVLDIDGEQVIVTGDFFPDSIDLIAVAIAGSTLDLATLELDQVSGLASPHSATPDLNSLSDVEVVTASGSDTYTGVLYFDPADIPTITALDVTEFATTRSTVITATGTDLNLLGGVNVVGYFNNAPDSGRPPIPASGNSPDGGYSAVNTGGTATSITFSPYGAPVGNWYVVPGFRTDDGFFWAGTSQIQVTVTQN
jgi:hypothetical protein